MNVHKLWIGLLASAMVGCAHRYEDWRATTSAEVQARVGTTIASPAVEARVTQLLSEPLDANRAVAIAMLNNPSVRALFEEVGAAHAELLMASSYSNPILDADLRFESGGALTVEAAVVQSVLDLIFVPLRSSVAESTFLAEQARITGEIVGLAADVHRAFIDYVAATQVAELRQQVVSATELASDLSRRLHTAGNITDLARLGDEAAATHASMELSEAEQLRSIARERLNALLGVWGETTSWRTEARLMDPCGTLKPLAVLEQCAVAKNLELVALRHRLDAASKRAGFGAWESVLGESALGASYTHEESRDSVGTAFSIPLPLFNWGRGEREASLAELRRLEFEYKARAIHIRADAKAAWSRAKGAEQRAQQLLSTLIPLRHKITIETQRHYNAMLLGGFELFRAKQDEIEAGIAYLEALKEYWHARAAIDTILSGVGTEER